MDESTTLNLINLSYLLAAVLFIRGLKGLTHPRTAVRGNLLGALGMLIAVVATLIHPNLDIMDHPFGYMLIVGGIVTWALGSFLDKTGMSGTDRVVGVFFGGLRGIILIAIAIIIVGLVPAIADNTYWKQSKLVPQFQPLADWGKQMWDNSGLQRKLNGYIDGIAGEEGGAIIELSPQDAARPGETVKPQEGIELPLSPEKPAETSATDNQTTTAPVTEPSTPATGN